MNALEIISRPGTGKALPSARPARSAKLFQPARRLWPAGTLARLVPLAALALFCCLAASPAPAAESGREPAVTVGGFTFTPPAELKEGASRPGLSEKIFDLGDGVDKNVRSPLYHFSGSGRHVQFVSAQRPEKNVAAALKAVVGIKLSAKGDSNVAYSLGDGLGVGIKGGALVREWAMLTKDGRFFFISTRYCYPDVKSLVNGLKADNPGDEVILAALKSPQVQNWLSFGVLDPNQRMSRDLIVFTVPDGWSYEEKDGEVRMVSPDGKYTTTTRPLPDQSLNDQQCLRMAEKLCEEENGQGFDAPIEYASWRRSDTEYVTYKCMRDPLLLRIIETHPAQK